MVPSKKYDNNNLKVCFLKNNNNNILFRVICCEAVQSGSEPFSHKLHNSRTVFPYRVTKK